MNPGKVSEVTYKRAILKNLNSKNEGVKPGVNAANIQLEDITAVVSSNCILKTFDGCEEFYVQRSINSICEKGGVPKSLQLSITIPLEFEEKEVNRMIKNFRKSADSHNVEINQCNVYRGATEGPIINIFMIGTTGNLLKSDSIKPGMDVIMAGTLAIGGTSVIAERYKDKLAGKFSRKLISECLELKDYTSTEKASAIAIDAGAVYMHAVSEGGLFSGLWEVASCVDKGIQVDINKIPIWQQVIEIAEFMDINPYLLEGSGSLLIVSPDGYKIEESLNANGIYGEVIGKITDNKNRVVINGDETRYLEPPRGDEIYKFI